MIAISWRQLVLLLVGGKKSNISRPDAILDLFVTRIINPYGIYCVKINIDGQWTAVYVDDLFPTKNGKPIFT